MVASGFTLGDSADDRECCDDAAAAFALAERVSDVPVTPELLDQPGT